jgi:hypothetical protein
MYLNQARNYFYSDPVFDALFPVYVKQLSEVHWTPLNVAFTAARFLAPDNNARVIDIGAGVGKFCIAGKHAAQGVFTGIEQRKNFVTVGNKIIRQLGLFDVTLIHGNFTQLDLTQYTGIYFFNSFHENLVLSDSLDTNVERSTELFTHYNTILLTRLKAMPVGTRLATYWLSHSEIPACYKLYESHYNNLLKLWIKEY